MKQKTITTRILFALAALSLLGAATHAADLVTTDPESGAQRLDRIVKNFKAANRPPVLVGIIWPQGDSRYHATADNEFGIVLLKAGFPVLDARSERKPDIEISGVGDHSEGPRRAGLFSNRAVVEMKVQERRTGLILAMDRPDSAAVDSTQVGAQRSAQALAVDELAERFLPLLAK